MTKQLKRDDAANYLVDCIGYSELDIEGQTFKDLIDTIYSIGKRDEFIKYSTEK